MHYPPPGPGYGPPQHHPGGYGGHPYGPYGGGPPPPKPSSNVAVIVLVVLVAFVVIAGGGCLVCVILAGAGATADAADAAGTPTPTPTGMGMGDRTVDRTPLAIKLEAALRNDGVPLDHVECPIAPPSPRFSCAVLPPNEGDPAEVVVTNGPNGMAYELQEGFVILDGAKLASTFAGIAARMGSPQMTASCFRGKILKHADTSFTCEVQSGGTVVGYVTTTALGKSGEVKMDYQPIAKPGANGGGAKSPTPTGSLDGVYACLTATYQRSSNGTFSVQYVPSVLPRFTIEGGSYTSGGKIGMIRTSGQVVMFLDGAYDGWQGVLGSNTTGRYILLRGTNHGDAQPGVGTKIGDNQCYVQR